MGSPNLNGMEWLLCYEGMGGKSLQTIDKAGVFRDGRLLCYHLSRVVVTPTMDVVSLGQALLERNNKEAVRSMPQCRKR